MDPPLGRETLLTKVSNVGECYVFTMLSKFSCPTLRTIFAPLLTLRACHVNNIEGVVDNKFTIIKS